MLQHIELSITNIVTQLIQSYLGDKHIMNNQQTLPFSVRVNKEDFSTKAIKAYHHYSKLSKQYLEDKEHSERIMNIINMVSISSDEFVDVTEDIYKLIYTLYP